MKIVITGSESFVGKELIKQCRDHQIKVIGFDLMERSDASYEFHRVDVRSKKIDRYIPEKVDAIVHLAALSRDSDCRDKAYECFDSNVMGTLNVIRAAEKRKAGQFIFASSEWVYDKFIGNEIKDEDALIDIANHTSEYALSKLVSEANLRQTYKHGFCPITILRFGIIYGPRKTNWSAVESILSAVKNQGEVTVGSLKTGRRFIHVSDIANGILKSIDLPEFNIINLVGNKLITLRELIEKSERLLGKRVTVIETNPSLISLRNPSNKKAKKMLNWRPLVGLEEGLKTLLPFV